MRPEEVRRRATRPVHIGLVAATRSGYVEMEHFLIVNGAPRHQVHRADDGEVPPQVDLVLYEPGLSPPAGGYSFDPDDTGSCIPAILHDHDELALALARQFPAFRAPAAVLFRKQPPEIRSVGVVISGGNVDFEELAKY